MRFSKVIGIIAVLISLYIAWRIRVILLLAFTAVALATVLNRLVKKLREGKLSRGAAIAITFLAIGAIIVGLIALALPPFVNQVQEWINRLPEQVIKTQVWLDWIASWLPPAWRDQVQRLENLVERIPNLVSGIFNNLFMVFSKSLSIVLNTLLVIFITIMLLANPKAYRQVFMLLFPVFYRPRIRQILDQCEVALVGWSQGILFNMVVISLLSGLGLWLLGIPLPLPNALLAGLLTFIPNVGPTLSVIPPAILGLLETPWKGLAVVILYIAIQQIESNILTPLVMKKQVSLLPALTLLSQASFAVLFGIFGLFLALPITVVAQVWLSEVLVKDILNQWHKDQDRNRIDPRTSKNSKWAIYRLKSDD